ncbi:MAG: hypothetical protein ACRDIY_00185 [Chloroflexota bacterium]
MQLSSMVIALATLLMLGMISSALLDSSQVAFKETFVGHTGSEIGSAVRAGRVVRVVVAVDHASNDPVALSLYLRDHERWALQGSGQVATALSAIAQYNQGAPPAERITVDDDPSYSGPTPVHPNASPTAHPRPSIAAGS